jgi:hypothetical protein
VKHGIVETTKLYRFAHLVFGLRNLQTPKDRNLHEVQGKVEGDCSQKLEGQDPDRKGGHFEAAVCEERNEENISGCGHDELLRGEQSPKMLTITNGVGDCLTAIDDADDTKRAEMIDIKMHLVLTDNEDGSTERQETRAENYSGRCNPADIPRIGSL